MHRTPVAACARWIARVVPVAHAVLVAVAVAPAIAQDNAAPQPQLKLSTAVAPAFELGRAGERWMEHINEKAGGAFWVQQYPGAVLASRDPQREFGALRDGAADLAVGSALAWSAQMPSFAVYALPWLAAETREQEALAADAAVREQVAARAALAGVVVLAVAPLGDRVLATVKDAVRTPAELAGLRLRAPANALVIETFAALGARADAMTFAAAQAALAEGTLDGQEAPASTLAATRIVASGQRFVTRWGAFSDVMVFAVRRGVWEGWSDDQRALVRAAADDAARESAALAREDAALMALNRQGVTLVRLAPAQRAAFRALAQPVWSRWTHPIGPDLVQAAQTAVAAAAASTK